MKISMLLSFGICGVCLIFLLFGCATMHVNNTPTACKVDYFSFMKNMKAVQAEACGMKVGVDSSLVDSGVTMLLGEGIKAALLSKTTPLSLPANTSKAEPTSTPKGTDK